MRENGCASYPSLLGGMHNRDRPTGRDNILHTAQNMAESVDRGPNAGAKPVLCNRYSRHPVWHHPVRVCVKFFPFSQQQRSTCARTDYIAIALSVNLGYAGCLYCCWYLLLPTEKMVAPVSRESEAAAEWNFCCTCGYYHIGCCFLCHDGYEYIIIPVGNAIPPAPPLDCRLQMPDTRYWIPVKSVLSGIRHPVSALTDGWLLEAES